MASLWRLSAILGLASWVVSSHAIQVVPIAYSMPNGSTGNYQYWDDSYTGSGCLTCNGAALSGGVGDLTNGVVATGSWDVVEAPAGPGPYVGWNLTNPTINFDFGAAVIINSVSFHFDNNNGVFAPNSVVIAGQSYTIAPPTSSGPFWFTVSGLNLNTSTVPITLVRNGNWLFASEIRFDNVSAVPEASTSLMMALGGLMMGGVALRRRRSHFG